MDNYAGHYLYAVNHANSLAESLWAVRERLVERARLNGKAIPEDDEGETSTLDYYMDLCDRAGLPDCA